MNANYSIDIGKALVIAEYATHPENTGKTKRQLGQELDVPESAVRRSLTSIKGEAVAEVRATLVRPMTKAEAMQATKSILAHMESARKLVLDLHDREGWKALGYKSWRECVQVEFGQSKSTLYRQLEAAKVERDVAPDEPSGSIPESHLLPLADLPGDERREAYEEATATAPGGKLTGSHVKATVEAKKSKTANPDEATDSGTDFSQNGKNTSSGSEVVDIYGVEFTRDEIEYAYDRAGVPTDGRPDFAGDEPEAVPGPLSDADWLETLPARSKLTDATRPGFDVGALAYRHLAESDAFAALRKLHGAESRKCKGLHRTPEYIYRFGNALDLAHPRTWLACGNCGGAGCDTCKRAGYAIA